MSTIFKDDRENALKVGFEATDWTKPVSYEMYCETLKDWKVQTIVRDGKVIGATFSKDGEIHASVLPQWRKKWATKGLLKTLFEGQDMTKVTPGHEYMYGILNRLGFDHIGYGIFVKGY